MIGPRKMIPDEYASYEEVTAALRNAGLEKSQLMVGVDFTQSNEKMGQTTFGGRSLHDVSDETVQNPYQQAMSVIAKALWDFDDDHMIPVYGFGDSHTRAHGIFSFQEGDKPCKGLVAALNRYSEIAKSARLWGPTSFAPLIRQAINVVRETNEYHILLILADGQVTKDHVAATTNAIVEASNYALSIVMVGVGDGPWDLMDRFDDELPQRRFDNFQFVEFSRVFDRYPAERREAAFATHALMEVPEQYQAVRHLGLLEEKRTLPKFDPPPAVWGPPDGAKARHVSAGLPVGWCAVWDPQCARYAYVNTATSQTSWEKPAAPIDASGMAEKGRRGSTASTVSTSTPSTSARSTGTSSRS
jgi:E3 ubiquitin-protein ligase RGLG